MKLLINIRGTNGSGKSSIPMAMLSDPEMYILYSEEGRKKPYATVFPTYKVVALGTYLNKTGGMDVFPNNEYTKNALKKVWQNFSDYNIILEGIIASTIKSTYATLFTQFNSKYAKRKIIILNFLPPVETCLARIQERNGGVPINEKLVLDKWNIVDRNVQYFKDAGFISVRVDNSKFPKEEALRKFIKFCRKHEEA